MVPEKKTSKAVLIVDDHELVRLGLRCAIESRGLPLSVLEAPSLKEAVQAYQAQADTVALVLLDLNLPDAKGLSALRTFKTNFPNTPVIVLSATADKAIAEEAISLGASAFVDKCGPVPDLTRLIVETIFGSASEPNGAAQGVRTPLNASEVLILDLLLQGRSNNEISTATTLSVGTVKNYISGLLCVFGAGSRSRLISMFG